MGKSSPEKGDAVFAKKSYPYANLYQGNRGEIVDVGALIRVAWVNARGERLTHSFAKVQFDRYFNIVEAPAEPSSPESPNSDSQETEL